MAELKTTTNRKVEITKRPAQPPWFCDFSNVTAGTFGVKISFGFIAKADDDGMEVEEYTQIGMTAEHALALYNLLGQHLEAYRHVVGPIKLTPDEAQSDDQE